MESVFTFLIGKEKIFDNRQDIVSVILRKYEPNKFVGIHRSAFLNLVQLIKAPLNSIQ